LNHEGKFQIFEKFTDILPPVSQILNYSKKENTIVVIALACIKFYQIKMGPYNSCQVNNLSSQNMEFLNFLDVVGINGDYLFICDSLMTISFYLI
jgi:hypothetical protein